jgi:Icc-related predicted phosphoesterase
MIRVAAVGDLHIEPGSTGRLRQLYQRAADEADLLLVAGDLTANGTYEQTAEACMVLHDLDLPVIAVLGNHDHDGGAPGAVTAMLADAGVTVLDGTTATVDVAGTTVGIAGAKGFCGGFAERCALPHGEDEMVALARHAEATAAALAAAIASLDTEMRVVVTHYAPIRETLVGEPVELYPFLGSHLLAAAIDGGRIDSYRGSSRDPDGYAPGADADEESAPRVTLAIHGHAHYGTECGATPRGAPVRNVAAPVIGAPYAVYRLTDLARLR